MTAMLALKEETDFLLILMGTGKRLQSAKDSATWRNVYTWTLWETKRMLRFTLLCPLLFDTRNRKVVSIASGFSHPLEHPNTAIKMLINFFSGIQWRWDWKGSKTQQKSWHRQPPLKKHFPGSMDGNCLQERCKGKIENKFIVVMKHILP